MAKKGQEIKISSYYQSLRDKNFIDTNFMCKLGMEFFFSELLFKGDLSRVLYSKEDIAFRRRIETVGRGDIKGKKLSYMTLDLPFAIYSQESGITEDDRGSTQNAGQIVRGQIDPDTGIVTKAAAVKVNYESTVFFSNLDDVNIATQLLYFEKTPKAPLYFVVESDICGTPLDIPVFISLDEINFEPQYSAQTKAFLTEAKIIPIKLNFTIRTYQVLIEDVEKRIKLPLRFSGIYAYNDQEIVFTQKTSLIWANSKFGGIHDHVLSFDQDGRIIDKVIDMTSLSDTIPSQVIKIEGDETLIKNETEQEVILLNNGNFKQEKLDDIIADTISGYFNESRDCTLLEFHQNDDKSTEESIAIDYQVKPEELQNFSKINFYIPGVCNFEISDPDNTQAIIKDLYPGSTYTCTIILYSKMAGKLTYTLELTTKGEKSIKKLSDTLIGRTFTGI